MQEPSVLDYVKAKLTPWRGPAPQIPPAGPGEAIATAEQSGPAAQSVLAAPAVTGAEAAPAAFASAVMPAAAPATGSGSLAQAQAALQTRAVTWPWRSLVALSLALIAQRTFEPSPGRTYGAGALLYLLAFAWLAWAYWEGEWKAAPLPESRSQVDRFNIQWTALWIGLPMAMIAFWLFGGGKFTSLNLIFWISSLALVMRSFWIDSPQSATIWQRLNAFIKRPHIEFELSSWTVLVLVVALLVVFFRIYRLSQVPPEMVSDHAEKLLDVGDVLNGQTSIFFPRNTGREAIQMYLTAAVALIFGTGLSFLSLKIGTIIAGLLTLPFIYLLGKEVANRRVGLLAAAFAGIAYWPNAITRVGLRFTLYPCFVAPTLYFLMRGIRRSNRNDFILAGLFLGLGLHGYTPFRIVPFVVVIAVGLYLLHRQSAGVRKQTIWRLAILAFVSFIVFLPLFRYALANPEQFSYRALSRLGSAEQPLPGPAWQIFLKNTWNAVTMFAWDDGEIWPISVTHRPALDVVSAALFYLGLILLLMRYLRQRHWLDLFLILSVPLLMLPSILSLAFPNENPAINRAAAAMVPVFLIVALALDGLLSSLQTRLGASYGRNVALAAGVLLLAWSSLQNYDLLFNQYYRSYELSSWNTTQLGQVIHDFAHTIGTPDSAWVVAYPYWVDTRLVGINAGYPTKDYAIWPDHFNDTLAVPGPKLFIINLQDTNSLNQLKSMYPQGYLQLYSTQDENKDFLLFLVPPQNH